MIERTRTRTVYTDSSSRVLHHTGSAQIACTWSYVGRGRSISVARSGHLARQSPVKRTPLRSPAREQRRRGCSSAPSTRRRRPEADQYGNLADIDRVERDE